MRRVSQIAAHIVRSSYVANAPSQTLHADTSKQHLGGISPA